MCLILLRSYMNWWVVSLIIQSIKSQVFEWFEWLDLGLTGLTGLGFWHLFLPQRILTWLPPFPPEPGSQWGVEQQGRWCWCWTPASAAGPRWRRRSGAESSGATWRWRQSGRQKYFSFVFKIIQIIQNYLRHLQTRSWPGLLPGKMLMMTSERRSDTELLSQHCGDIPCYPPSPPDSWYWTSEHHRNRGSYQAGTETRSCRNIGSCSDPEPRYEQEYPASVW